MQAVHVDDSLNADVAERQPLAGRLDEPDRGIVGAGTGELCRIGVDPKRLRTAPRQPLQQPPVAAAYLEHKAALGAGVLGDDLRVAAER
jgi:hypothetical protein